MVKYGLMLLHKEIEVRAAAIKRGEPVKGGRNPVLKARLLGLRLTNLRDDRELAKGNKLDSVRCAGLPSLRNGVLADPLPRAAAVRDFEAGQAVERDRASKRLG